MRLRRPIEAANAKVAALPSTESLIPAFAAFASASVVAGVLLVVEEAVTTQGIVAAVDLVPACLLRPGAAVAVKVVTGRAPAARSGGRS